VSTPEHLGSAPEDRELDALLARSGRVHAAWREASAEEPPGALDDAIRAAARRAVHAGPRPRHGSFAARWRVPLSIAALLVVSATLTLLLAERGEHVPGTDLRQAPALAPRDQATEADASAPDRKPATEAPPPARQPAVAPLQGQDQRAQRQSTPMYREQVPAQPEVTPAQHPDQPGARGDAQVPATSAGSTRAVEIEPNAGALADRAARFEAPPPPAPPDAAGRISAGPGTSLPAEAGPPVPVKPAAPTPAQAAPAAKDAAPDWSEGAAPDGTGRATPDRTERATAAQAELSKHDAPAALSSPARPLGETRAEPSAGAKRQESTGVGAQDDSRAARKREALQAGEAKTGAAPELEPKAWIERILGLRREGKLEQAQRSLLEFRRRYPDYPLPPELVPRPTSPSVD